MICLLRPLICGLLVCLLASSGAAAEKFEHVVPLGMKPPVIPADNALTAAKIDLGRQLYFEPRLSRDNTVSCATCHDPDKGWSNGQRFGVGVRGQKGGRNTPTILNAAYYPLQFWDGRASLLEGQALGPIQNPIEMDLTLPEAIERLNKIPGYVQQFQAIYGTPATAEALAKSLAAFERTVLSGGAPYDRYQQGDKSALSASAVRGLELFTGKAHCSACHAGPPFSDSAFHNIGVGMEQKEPDEGRMTVSKQLGDRGAFKTPGLRDIHRSGPYMHDGSKTTLTEVVEYYNRGGTANPQLDEELYPLTLTASEVADVVKFLEEGLASEKYPHVKAPKLPE